MSCGSTELCKQPGEQLVLRVERFLALGGTADVYQVRLLQQNSGAASQPAAAAPTQPAARAAHQHDEELQPGRQFAIKVARRLESYPAEQAGDACPALYLKGMGASVRQEWRVVQDLFSCRNIIKAFRLGCVAAATTALNMAAPTAAASSGGQQRSRTSQAAGSAAAERAVVGNRAGVPPAAAMDGGSRGQLPGQQEHHNKGPAAAAAAAAPGLVAAAAPSAAAPAGVAGVAGVAAAEESHCSNAGSISI
ncbi:hypothetical protein COO60DRAFT_561725 [Scenedesmus sp. NREL 46B-D3]|nr:hypothetical protein COO60DRAFT_561725 [Scenedesmus sp. NREL 46B-D3]